MLLKFFKAGFGGVSAQAVNLLSLPIISRLYAPDEYAVWAIAIATAGIFGGIACLRYELAIVIPSDDEQATTLFWWCVVSSLGMGVLVSLGSLCFSYFHVIQSTSSGGDIINTVYAPVLVTLMGITLAWQYWSIRQQSFAINSLSQLGMAVVTLAVQASYAAVYQGDAIGLLIGSVAGQMSAVLVLTVGNIYMSSVPRLSKQSVGRIPEALKLHNRFFKYSTPYSLFGTLRARASVYVLALFLSPKEIGLYAFAYRIMNFPVSLVSSALRPVIFQETAEKGSAALEQKINEIIRWLAYITTPLVVVYFFWAEELFTLFFGPKWTGAAFYGKFFVLPVFTFLFCNWMDRIMDVMGQQHLTMYLEIGFSTLSIAALWFGFEFELGLFWALLLQCIVLITYNLTYLVLAYKRAGYEMRPLMDLGLRITLIACVSFIVSMSLSSCTN